MAGSISASVLNIGGADPVQGFDVGVWVFDTGRGNARVFMGQFTSIVVTVRNATEAYIEFGQRYPRYLDGEIQIAYVMEKGFLDINVFQETFGYKRLSRNKRFGRSPRFDVVFGVNPVDADILEGQISTALDASSPWTRDVTGRFILETCKMDSWHIASTAGRQVVANQWQGVAEGFSSIAGDSSTSSDGASPTMTQITSSGIPTFQGMDFYRSVADGIANTDKQFQGWSGL